MAKIFWIAKKEGNDTEMFAFNNKRKAQQKAMELAPNFSFGDNEVEHEIEWGTQILYSGTINAKNCFILYRENDMPYAKGDFANASEAYGWMEEKGRKVVAGACFPVKLKGGMCSVDIWDQVGVLQGEELFKFDKYVENDPDFDWYADEVGPDGKPLQIWATPDGKKPKSESFKYVPTFESFLNEAKIEFGNLDPRKTEDKWKLEELNDMLRKAVGKKCTFLDIVNIAGHQSGFYDESTTKNTPKNVLKKINVEILDIEVGGSYDSMAHQIYYKYDAAPYNGYEYKTNGKADLTGEVAYGKNNAKDENGDFNGAGVKFKDFPKIYPDCAAVTTARGFGSQKGFSSGSFLMYPKSDAAAMWSMFADVFRLGDITPNF